MSCMTFFVPGRPRGKGRPRFTRTGHTYTDEATRRYEEHIRWHYMSQPHAIRYDAGTAVSVHCNVCVPVPISWPRKRREEALMGCEYPQAKPDIDNVFKAVLDALTGLAWDDDKQVAVIVGTKRFVERGNEGLQITLEGLEGRKL